MTERCVAVGLRRLQDAGPAGEARQAAGAVIGAIKGDDAAFARSPAMQEMPPRNLDREFVRTAARRRKPQPVTAAELFGEPLRQRRDRPAAMLGRAIGEGSVALARGFDQLLVGVAEIDAAMAGCGIDGLSASAVRNAAAGRRDHDHVLMRRQVTFIVEDTRPSIEGGSMTHGMSPGTQDRSSNPSRCKVAAQVASWNARL